MTKTGNMAPSSYQGIADAEEPMVSVVIPCYNHGHFLGSAIESVLAQTYRNFEIIVVDDGSADATKAVAGNYSGIIYIRQENKGLAAARNTGLTACSGEYVVFLDADDLLLPEALKTNLAYFNANIPYAFVAGAHKKITADGKELTVADMLPLQTDAFKAFLKGNFIGMHAAVMYDKKLLLESHGFDTSLNACEDYELYFRLSSLHAVYNHQQVIAAYRIHRENMSSDIPFMLQHVLYVLRMQLPLARKKGLLKDYHTGRKVWKDYYLGMYVKQQCETYGRLHLIPLAKWLPVLRYGKFWALKRIALKMKANLKRFTPLPLKRLIHRIGLLKEFVPPTGRIRWGDMRRTSPFSTQFGFDRKGPVDRYYIEKFLAENAVAIAGRVLEVGDNEYTLRYGGNNVTTSDILHVTEGNPKATFTGDLATAGHIPSNAFDCIILTQTLHLIYDYKEALRTCYRILKPGGSLLLTVPGISQIEQGEWTEHWLWAFTEKSVRLIVEEACPEATLSQKKYGNVLAAAAFLYGVGSVELSKEELDFPDPHYQVLITAKITKKKVG